MIAPVQKSEGDSEPSQNVIAVQSAGGGGHERRWGPCQPTSGCGGTESILSPGITGLDISLIILASVQRIHCS